MNFKRVMKLKNHVYLCITLNQDVIHQLID